MDENFNGTYKVQLITVIIFAIGTISESITNLGNGLFGLRVFDKIFEETVFAALTREYDGKSKEDYRHFVGEHGIMAI